MTAEIARAWRTILLGGLSCGVAAAALGAGNGPVSAGGPDGFALAIPAAALAVFGAVRPAGLGSGLVWAAGLALAAFTLGLSLGDLRLASIDRGAAPPVPASTSSSSVASFPATVTAYPRRSRGVVRFPVQAERGRLSVEAGEPVEKLVPGDTVRLEGEIGEPADWYAPYLEQNGIFAVLEAERVTRLPDEPPRGGVDGKLDAVRGRAESAISAGMRSREAGIALGFVLGRIDALEPQTHEDFRRSGLAHLLAVSGQNVMLLVILAWLPLGAIGLPLMARVPVVIGLIAIYVPLAGAGPSIQRAGIMGVAGLVALWAGRAHSRLFGLLIAAAATLVLNPRAAGDIGWQLSFAAVAGIYAITPGLTEVARSRIRGGSAGRALTDGASITIAATISTAPLLCHHFGALPVGTLTANLLVMPAVAVSMWLGMSAAAIGQIPAAPVEISNGLNEVVLAYIAEIAATISRPPWALPNVELASPVLTGVLTAAAICLPWLGLKPARARAQAEPDGRAAGFGANRGRNWRARAGVAIAAVVIAGPLLASTGFSLLAGGPGSPDELRVTALDIGQGDAILLQDSDRAAILVDTGPPGQSALQKLRGYGVAELDAVLITHVDDDHSGGLRELLGQIPIGAVIHGAPLTPELELLALENGVPVRAVAAGAVLRAGRIGLEVLGPVPEKVESAHAAGLTPDRDRSFDTNDASVVALARMGGTRVLLTGDAENEGVPLDPGPIEILKVAHHGSADNGLDAFLARTRPRLALISAGRDNPFGHPAPSTLESLESVGTEIRRTDLEGDITIDLPYDRSQVRLRPAAPLGRQFAVDLPPH